MPSPDEIATVFKHLTPQARVVFIAEKAKVQDMAWLRGMAEQGAFLVPAENFSKDSLVRNLRLGSFNDMSFQNAAALTGVMDGTVFEGLTTLPNSKREKPLTLEVSDDFKAFLFETSLALMQSANDFRERHQAPPFPSPKTATENDDYTASVKAHTDRVQHFGVAINATFLALLQTACACDDGKTANLLLQGTNTLGTMYSPSAMLGTAAIALPGTVAEREAALVNPMYTAMLFSAHSALSAFENHGFPLLKVIAQYPRAPNEAKSEDSIKAFFSDKFSPRIPVDFVSENALPCTPSMLKRVLDGMRLDGYRKIDVEPLVKEAHRLLVKGAEWNSSDYEKEMKMAFQEAEVFELKGKQSASLAVKVLDVGLVDRLEYSINWLESLPFGGTQYNWEVTSILTAPINKNAAAVPMAPDDKHGNGSEAMVLMLMEFAARAGHGFRIYEQGSHQAALVKWAIEKDHPKVLVKMMENGLEPDRYLLLNDTAYGLAEKAGKKEAEHLMRTYLSGQRARNALAEIDFDDGPVVPNQRQLI